MCSYVFHCCVVSPIRNGLSVILLGGSPFIRKKAPDTCWSSTSQQSLVEAHYGHALNDACMKQKAGEQRKVTADRRVGSAERTANCFWLTFSPPLIASFLILLPSLHSHLHSFIHPFTFNAILSSSISLQTHHSDFFSFHWKQLPRACQAPKVSLLSKPKKNANTTGNSGPYRRRRTWWSSPRDPLPTSRGRLDRLRAKCPDPTHWQHHCPQSSGPATYGAIRAFG